MANQELDHILFETTSLENLNDIEIQTRDDAKSGSHIVRKRARKACTECHKRKVRCDVLTRGQVCTNCRLDGLQCTLPTGKRRRLNNQCIGPDLATSLVSVDNGVEEQDISAPLEVPSPSHDITLVPAEPPSNSWLPKEKYQDMLPSSDIMYSYYDFIGTEPLSHLASEDFVFLEQKRCFHLPCRELLDECVKQYFLHVHPMLPLIHEGHFWDIYTAGGSRRSQPANISLFVFRCMLFASSSFLTPEVLRALGFSDGLQARNILYQRAKMLYDFGTVTDSIDVAQGALLLSFYVSDREALVNSSWLSTAIQHATAEGAHLHDQDSSRSGEVRNIIKRLWWCCILRDRILPLGVRRSIQISREDYDLSKAPLDENDLEDEFEQSCVYLGTTRRKLASIFCDLLDLAIKLTDVISLIYPIGGVRALENDQEALLQAPLKIQVCKAALSEWSERNQKTTEAQELHSQHKSIYLFHELNQIYFQSAKAALCQYESLVIQTHADSNNPCRMQELGSEIHSVMASISDSVGCLVSLGLVRYVPISLLAYLALPFVLNSIDVESSSTSFKNEAKRRRLRLYNEAMDFCYSRYNGTAAASKLLAKIVASARERAPVRRVCPKEEMRLPDRSTMAATRSTPHHIDDWFRVFVNRPLEWLRITMTIDMSLSHGKIPDLKMLPRRLHVEMSPTDMTAISRSLDPRQVGGGLEMARFPGFRTVNLDFFELGPGSADDDFVLEEFLESTEAVQLMEAVQSPDAEKDCREPSVGVGVEL